MKKINFIAKFLIIFLGTLIMYLPLSFIEASFNFFEWDISKRKILGMLWGLFMIIAVPIIFDWIDEDEKK